MPTTIAKMLRTVSKPYIAMSNKLILVLIIIDTITSIVIDPMAIHTTHSQNDLGNRHAVVVAIKTGAATNKTATGVQRLDRSKVPTTAANADSPPVTALVTNDVGMA